MPKYNLNRYEKVNPGEEVLPSDLVITPKKLPDGTQLPDLVWRKPKPKVKFVVNKNNVSEAIWRPNIPIDIKVSEDDYKFIVNWWFNEARNDAEYAKSVRDTFKMLGSEVLSRETNKARNWLLKNAYFANARGEHKKRRKDLDKFLDNWLTKASNNISNSNKSGF